MTKWLQRNWKIVLGVLISILSLVVSIHTFDLSAIWHALKVAHYPWVIPAVLLYLGALAARTLRMQVLFRKEQHVTLNRLLATMAMGRGANNIYPFRVGEIVRWTLFHKLNRISGPLALASILIERVFDGLTMLLFLVVVALTGGIPAEWRDLAWGALALFGVALTGIYALVLWPARFQALSVWFIQHMIPGRFRERVEEISNRLILSFAAIRSAGSLTMVLLFSILVWSFETAMYRTMMISFGIDVSFHRLMLMSATANLATSLPSAPGNIGTFDGAVILTLKSTIGESLSIAYISLLHAVLWSTETLAGLYFMWRTGTGRLELARMASVDASHEGAIP
ncbi:MAG: flippase-like domain-containing protein [Anaerolineales bacterium]|nr:flippase-like domain-containing protein [Anaerolineales bacterium]